MEHINIPKNRGLRSDRDLESILVYRIKRRNEYKTLLSTTPYKHFRKANETRIIEENPAMPPKYITNQLKQLWKELNDQDAVQIYIDQVTEDKIRYETEFKCRKANYKEGREQFKSLSEKIRNQPMVRSLEVLVRLIEDKEVRDECYYFMYEIVCEDNKTLILNLNGKLADYAEDNYLSGFPDEKFDFSYDTCNWCGM